MAAALLGLRILAAVLALGAALVMALGAVVMFGHTAGAFSVARRSRAWPTVRGKITRSEIRPNTLANRLPGNRYLVEYAYEVESQDYDCNMVAGAVFPYGTKRWAARRIRLYAIGSDVEVHYDPADPEVAVLEPGANWELLYSLFIVLLPLGVAASLLGLAYWLVWGF